MSIRDALALTLLGCEIDRPTAGVMESDFEIRQLREMMNEAGRNISRRAEWSGAQREATLTSGMAQYDLPADFQEMAEAGAVSISGVVARPIVDPTLWEMIEATPSSQPFYHIQQGRLFLAPPPAAEVALRYASTNWLAGGGDRIASDDDEPVFPSDLLAKATIWRWRRQKGLAYEDHLAEFEAELEAAIKADRGAL